MNTKLGIIIPTYDSLDTLKILIGNILDYTDGDYQIYVVEDGQKKETISYLEEQKEIIKIYHDKNKGVAVSWNDGLEQAIKDNCTHFAILNDDIELPKDWWKECRKMFDKDIHLLSLNTEIRDFSGWFFIIDRKCLEIVGKFDEQFAPYCSEDDDYFERYKQSQLKRGIIDLKIFHHGSKTLKKIDSNEVDKIRMENRNKFIKKYPNKRIQA